MHLGNISYRLGRTLTFDSKKMECVGDREANAMFKRKYRSPYVAGLGLVSLRLLPDRFAL
jgi:hypothetical protein